MFFRETQTRRTANNFFRSVRLVESRRVWPQGAAKDAS